MANTIKKRVLLMDDEPMIQRVTGQMLENLGYEVDKVFNGEEAIESYTGHFEKETAFYCVIMDLQIIGGMGAEETLEKLLIIDPNVKAIVSTGYAHDPQVIQHKKFGFSAALVKPYKLAELKNAIEGV